MPDGAGTNEATGEGITELVILLPHGGSVTIQFNPYRVSEHPVIRYPYLVSEHPIIRCVLCVVCQCTVIWVMAWTNMHIHVL